MAISSKLTDKRWKLEVIDAKLLAGLHEISGTAELTGKKVEHPRGKRILPRIGEAGSAVGLRNFSSYLDA